MTQIAVICRKPEQFKYYVLNHVAIDIDDLHITPGYIRTANVVYTFTAYAEATRGIQFDYFTVTGPLGERQVGVIRELQDRGIEYFHPHGHRQSKVECPTCGRPITA